MEGTRKASMSAQREDAAEAPYLYTHRDGGIVTLTLARGERFNPLSSGMIAALQTALEDLAEDPSARVVILAAEGRGFCAGHDLKEMRAYASDPDWQRRLFDACAHLMLTLTRIPQPVIARVQGIATAAGCQLVSMCDLAVAADTAQFALPGVNIGLFCSTPAVGVVRNIGRKRTMEMLLTGHPISAETALDWGLVNRVVPVAQLDAAIRVFTEILLARSPATIRLGKQTFYAQIEQPSEAAYSLASEAMECNLQYEDAVEGMDAFLGKRAPAWRGR
jgi:enoyl-CoA hydratase/carnithine racemase